MGRLREIIIRSPEDLAVELETIDVDPGGIGIMVPKGRTRILRTRQLPSPAANILKQEMLSIGGECATGRKVILGDHSPGDVILMGTDHHFRHLARKLKTQPFGLQKLAGLLDDFARKTQSRRRPSPIEKLSSSAVELPLLMGVVNVTPDSFSDGGQFLEPEVAAEHARQLVSEGADVVDIGGESSRPGAAPVSAQMELDRVLPVIQRLKPSINVPLSIDTTKAEVARQALAQGADMVNDISAGRVDPDLLGVVADAKVPYVLMHMQGLPETMQKAPQYEHLMDDLHAFFDEQLDRAVSAGISEEQIIIDPGIGFGKSMQDNYRILDRLQELQIFGRPVLVGLSRKSLLKNPESEEPGERLEETVAAGTLAMYNGAHILRVHDMLPAVKSRVIVHRMNKNL